MKNSILFLAVFLLSGLSRAKVSQGPHGLSNDVPILKAQILHLAQSYQGQGDPDFSRQKSLEPLVQKLLKLQPQLPVKDRLPILYGVWKQVWGPYDYRHQNRGVDPQIGVDEIYQAIFPGGYYYNVSPVYKKGDHQNVRIGLLRGVYKLDQVDSLALDIQFTNYPGVNGRPDSSVPIWSLASLAESGKLMDQITIVPTAVVRLFFGSGALKEIYTDQDLRILYGASDKQFKNPYLYIMTRAH